MKKILLLILFLITSNVLGDWEPVTFNTLNSLIFVDKDTIRKRGNKVEFWQKINFNTPTTEVKSMRSFIEIDCKERTQTSLDVTAFSERNLQGNILSTFNPPRKIVYLAPDTAGDEILKYVCK